MKDQKEQIQFIHNLHSAQASLSEALVESMDKVVLSENFEQMVNSSPADISSRYWLMQFLEPLNRKELKSVVDGFLIQLLNEEQSKKLVKFLLIRFPSYFTGSELGTEGVQKELESAPPTPSVKPEEKPVV